VLVNVDYRDGICNLSVRYSVTTDIDDFLDDKSESIERSDTKFGTHDTNEEPWSGTDDG